MIIIFGIRRLRKGLGPVMLRCSNCGMSPLVLFRVSTWFALFFIPVIPVSFKHFTACANCKRLEQVSKDQVESARVQEGAMNAASQNGSAVFPNETPTLEHAVNEWASVGQAQSAPAEWTANPAGSPSYLAQSSPPPSPPAGWFPDPTGTAAHRYWDGLQWTEHTHP